MRRSRPSVVGRVMPSRARSACTVSRLLSTSALPGSTAEQRVAAEQLVVAVVGDVAEGVPWHRHHAKLEAEVCKADDVPVVERTILARHALSRRAEHLGAVPRGQCLDAADVVGMVMGDEDGAQGEPLLPECGLDGAVVSRIHYHCRTARGRRADQPEVVVRESPHWAHFEHRRPPSPSRA